jgi:hypothetical protein
MANVIVTGPGKCGGSLLMQILTELDIDTGFPKGLTFKNNDAGGNYEKKLRGSGTKFPLPYVIKEPQMCADIDLRIKKLKLSVDHIYILLRRPGPEAVALEFMRRGSSNPETFEEGLRCKDLERTTRGIARRELQVVNLVAELQIPHTLVSYPRFASDINYAFMKFWFLWEKFDIKKKDLLHVMDKVVDQKLVTQAYTSQPEWNRAKMREALHTRGNL